VIAVLIKTHFINRSLYEKIISIANNVKAYENLEFFLSIDITNIDYRLVTQLKKSIPEVRFHLFNSKLHEKHGFTAHEYTNTLPVNWFHNDYAIIDFFVSENRYDYIWQIEHDVYLKSGSWQFLAKNYDADFMAASIKVRSHRFEASVKCRSLVQPQWRWWNSLSKYEPMVGCFFPCIRISAKAIESLIAAYQAGTYGFCEVSVPSIISGSGLSVTDLSEINYDEATIMHPHWKKQYKEDYLKDFRLNQPLLMVDTDDDSH
jgi:hypothetical protein